MFFGNFSQIFYVKTSKKKPWYVPLIISMSGPWNWITSFKSISGANGWILGWMNSRWVSMDGTLIWINYNEQNPGQSPTDWNSFLTQFCGWISVELITGLIHSSTIHPSIHPPLMLCHSSWVHSHCTPQYVKSKCCCCPNNKGMCTKEQKEAVQICFWKVATWKRVQ